ncbi:13977_t:CDS:2 [Dentiscutata erythropus]|uniref:13977_t:CDS:1 n=1 Tax=Dentiscutata erythropus TaxID=1348616 RepID=A0A9N9DYU7_9GLOM|nr:13977_t:CDS:2 [Dentiscutata erythropus]
MPFCTSCSHTLSSEEFIYEGKSYKTCARCMIKIKSKPVEKDKLYNEKTIIEVIFVQDISNYIANAIADLENHSKLSLAFSISFDEVTLNTVGTDVKTMAKLIIDEIEKDTSNFSNKSLIC